MRNPEDLIQREREALRLLHTYTRGTFHIYVLAGPRNVKRRQEIMGVLDGVKVPQKSAGIEILTQRFIVMAGVGLESCIAARDDEFRKWANGVIGIAPTGYPMRDTDW